ncbi:MAG: sugar phosphate isomerase/epimerase [Opitutaceae bacterium]|nr:sugar phosphate isomerase/epimerase [Opitutaceae bacterium]
MSCLRAYSTLGNPQASLEECLAVAQAFDLDAVEVRALGGTIDVPAVLARTYGSPEALAEKLGMRSGLRRGVPVVAFGTSLRLIGSTAKEKEAFLDYLPWAEALDVRWLRVFDGGKRADAAELAEAAATVRWWQAERAWRRTTPEIMIETHDALVNAPAIRRFLQAAPGTAILWDSHHTWKKGGEDPVKTWAQISECVVHVHVKDSVSIPSARHPYTYALPGRGEFPIRPLMSELDRHFRGVVSLEWERMWNPELAPLEEALQSAREARWW